MSTRRRKARHHGYVLRIQLGLIVALSLTIVAFKADVRPGTTSVVDPPPTSAPAIKEIPPTDPVTAPPPPRPPVPMVVPNDVPLQTDELRLDAGLPIGTSSDVPPPPPADDDADDEAPPFILVEEMPEIMGGLTSLYERVEYPRMAKQAGIEGKVVVQFVVDKEGRVTDPVVLRSVHPLLDEAALRAVRDLRFRPGKQRDRPVRVQMSLPIVFRLR